MPGLRLACLALGAALALLAGCDSVTDGQPLDGRPPEVSDFAFSPDSVHFDDVLVGDSAEVRLALSVRAADPDGQIDRVRFAVEGRFGGTVAGGAMEDGGDGTYAATTTLRLGRDQRGRYSVLVYAVDDDGLLSNRAEGIFELAGAGLGPPVIEAIDGPAELRPPGTLRLVATVSDPDGPKNVARVELRPPVGGVIQLFDDGRAGDAAAGDGRFTISFAVPEAAPGPQPFIFRAIDRDGLASEDVLFTVTILE